MKEQLCGECISQNKCWFVNAVNERIRALPLSEKQAPIVSGVKITEEASVVNKQIAADRIRARSYACPQVNYNPQNRKFQPNL